MYSVGLHLYIPGENVVSLITCEYSQSLLVRVMHHSMSPLQYLGIVKDSFCPQQLFPLQTRPFACARALILSDTL